MQKWLLSWALTSLSVALAGCATPAEQQAETGLSDFEACDLRGASAAFANAHDLDPSRADFALAYALSTIAVLPENPAVTSVLLRLGFTSAIDTSALWGPGGVLDQLAAKSSTCQSVTDYLQAHIPYAPAQSNGPSAASVLRDPTLTGEDFAVAAADLVPILAKVVSALDQGAGAMGQFDIQGGCGVGTVHIEAPELYGLAAALELLVAVTDVAQAYDWGVPVSLVLDDSGQEQQYVAALNAHVLHLITPSALESGRLAGVYAMQLVQKGLTAAAQITTRPPNSLFDWTRVPAGVLSDVQTLTTWASQSLTTPGVMALPFFTPALSMDGHSSSRRHSMPRTRRPRSGRWCRRQ